MPSENRNKIYIGLGSNLGDSLAYLADAVRRMEERFQAKATVSSVYRSEPVELVEQPWFFNQAARFEVDGYWKPTAVLRVLKTIEQEMGRKKPSGTVPGLLIWICSSSTTGFSKTPIWPCLI